MIVRSNPVAFFFILALFRIGFLRALAEEDCQLSLLQTGASLLQRPGQVGQVGSDFFDIADPTVEATARAGQSDRRATAASVAPFDVGGNAVPLPRGLTVKEPKLSSTLLSLAEVSSSQAAEHKVSTDQADLPLAASLEVLESEPPFPLAPAVAKAPRLEIWRYV